MSNVIRVSTELSKKRAIGIQEIKQDLPSVSETVSETEVEKTLLDESKQLVAQANREAESILLEARARAKQIEVELAERATQLEQQWEERKLQAQSEGYETGFSAGESQALSIYEGKLTEAHHLLEQAQDQVEQSIVKNEPFLIELVLSIVRRVLKSELEHEGILATMVAQILQEVKDMELVKVYVHPSWYKKLVHSKEELQQQLPACQDFRIIPDGQRNETECVIVTNAGRLDASLDTQLLELKQQLTRVIGKDYVETTN
ncbi:MULTISPECIES: flagellar assembly protein FliH [Shouchella]|uniref:Flagellar assembly protein FliH n=2 Tax=Bacillaceae TaxID=186817 RepID=A0A060LXA5_9BACI|nr:MULTISPECIES: flagellar assembly protein FliH [Bacillaceae]AIC94832.1 flagellar assembly protein FliH [Shouchella lehensis G1]KQL58636.1 hypothetical protein AN965_01275 [Alkalicoccobacillus plakortidis]MBG9784312.1 hypothetical protein [Shouchella lehensis]